MKRKKKKKKRQERRCTNRLSGNWREAYWAGVHELMMAINRLLSSSFPFLFVAVVVVFMCFGMAFQN